MTLQTEILSTETSDFLKHFSQVIDSIVCHEFIWVGRGGGCCLHIRGYIIGIIRGWGGGGGLNIRGYITGIILNYGLALVTSRSLGGH